MAASCRWVEHVKALIHPARRLQGALRGSYSLQAGFTGLRATTFQVLPDLNSREIS